NYTFYCEKICSIIEVVLYFSPFAILRQSIIIIIGGGNMTKTRGVLLLIIMTLLMTSLSGCYLFPKEEEVLAPPLVEPPEITYETQEVKKGVIEKKITASGTFVSIEQANMFFKHRGGRLKKIHVKVGDYVEKGQLIAELDSADLEN